MEIFRKHAHLLALSFRRNGAFVSKTQQADVREHYPTLEDRNGRRGSDASRMKRSHTKLRRDLIFLPLSVSILAIVVHACQAKMCKDVDADLCSRCAEQLNYSNDMGLRKKENSSHS